MNGKQESQHRKCYKEKKRKAVKPVTFFRIGSRLKYFEGFCSKYPWASGVDQGPQTPCREVRDSRCVSTNPPLEIPAYGPESYVTT